MDLNKEAEQYAKSISKNQTYREYLEESFKSGVNSKYAQVKIIQGQIDVLSVVLKSYKLNDVYKVDLILKINQLEQQLKQLEDE